MEQPQMKMKALPFDEKVYLKFKTYCVEHQYKIGELITELMVAFLEKERVRKQDVEWDHEDGTKGY